MAEQDKKFMQMALKLAQRGISSVEPNPAVGCVIVKAGEVIGKGYHKKFGGQHAEINALGDCKKNQINPKGATMYVTLEPCCHIGKTGPCTDAIIKAKPAKVVVAMTDPSPHAGGKGIKQLRSAGIEVKSGACKDDAKLLNGPFVKFVTTKRCWVILKWAQSIDGKLAYTDPAKGRWISGEKSRKDAHKLRRRCQAILVGVNTVITDDPLLTPRPSRGKKPVRIVLDTNLRIPVGCKLLATANKVPVIIVTSTKAIRKNKKLTEIITSSGAELLTVPVIEKRCDIESLLEQLSERGIEQLLVEGGPKVITSFLKQNLADEIIIYIAPKILSSEGKADISKSIAKLADSFDLHHTDIKHFGNDVRLASILTEQN